MDNSENKCHTDIGKKCVALRVARQWQCVWTCFLCSRLCNAEFCLISTFKCRHFLVSVWLFAPGTTIRYFFFQFTVVVWNVLLLTQLLISQSQSKANHSLKPYKSCSEYHVLRRLIVNVDKIICGWSRLSQSTCLNWKTVPFDWKADQFSAEVVNLCLTFKNHEVLFIRCFTFNVESVSSVAVLAIQFACEWSQNYFLTRLLRVRRERIGFCSNGESVKNKGCCQNRFN